MRRPGFAEGLGVAIVCSVGSSIAYACLNALLPPDWAARLLITGLGLGYTTYLLIRSGTRVGRVATLALWSSATATALSLGPGLAAELPLQLGLIWIIRTLYFHPGGLAALADLALIAAGLATAVWATAQSGSVWLACWCFFLVQAGFGLIRTSPSPGSLNPTVAARDDEFETAYQTAVAALSRLRSHH